MKLLFQIAIYQLKNLNNLTARNLLLRKDNIGECFYIKEEFAMYLGVVSHVSKSMLGHSLIK